MLCLIPMAASQKRVSALRAIGTAAPLLPKLLLQTFLITLLVQLGFMAVFVPGVILAILFSLAPVMLANDKLGVFGSLKASSKLAWRNVKLIAPAIMLWLLAKVAIMLFFSTLTLLPANVSAVVLNALGNLVSALLVIYLYRLYMLVR